MVIITEFDLICNEEDKSFRVESRENPVCPVCGRTLQYRDRRRRVQSYTAIRQRIDINCVLPHLDRAETAAYIRTHLNYAGCEQELFTDRAVDEVFRISCGIPRMVNRICEKSLTYAAQQQKRLVDDHIVRYVDEHEMVTV